jgi:hypothetical protein
MRSSQKKFSPQGLPIHFVHLIQNPWLSALRGFHVPMEAYPVASHDPLSLWPQVSENLAVWLEAELASNDDPLETIGIAMITHWGPASLLLLLTAWAGSYAFPRAGPAFAALLAACILDAGGPELILIHRLAKSATDDQRPIAERRLVLERMRVVFFHPEASKSAIGAIADNTTLPEELRANARAIGMPRRYRGE